MQFKLSHIGTIKRSKQNVYALGLQKKNKPNFISYHHPFSDIYRCFESIFASLSNAAQAEISSNAVHKKLTLELHIQLNTDTLLEWKSGHQTHHKDLPVKTILRWLQQNHYSRVKEPKKSIFTPLSSRAVGPILGQFSRQSLSQQDTADCWPTLRAYLLNHVLYCIFCAFVEMLFNVWFVILLDNNKLSFNNPCSIF